MAVSQSNVVLIGVVNRAKAFGKSIKITFKYIFVMDLCASQEGITKGSRVYYCWQVETVKWRMKCSVKIWYWVGKYSKVYTEAETV